MSDRASTASLPPAPATCRHRPDNDARSVRGFPLAWPVWSPASSPNQARELSQAKSRTLTTPSALTMEVLSDSIPMELDACRVRLGQRIRDLHHRKFQR